MMLRLTNELDAVNRLLAIIGETPVDTVEDNGNADAAQAYSTLCEVNLDVQGRRWFWNTDRCFLLTPLTPVPPATTSQIPLPQNVLEIQSADYTYPLVTTRGGFLWDCRGNSDQFSQGVKVNITRLLDFQDIPEAGRKYITIRAGRIFQDRAVGSGQLNGFSKEDEMMAKRDLENHEAEASRASLMSDARVVNTVARNRGYLANR